MGIWRRLASLFSWFPWYRRQARDAELERELRDHLELEAEEQQADGLSPKQAAYAAHRALGNTLKIEEDVRRAWGFLWLETLGQDLRYGLRMLHKSPGFTAVAVLTLALGIGATTALFSVVNGVLLNPLPYPHPNQVVSVNVLYSDGGENNTSYPDFLDWVRDNHSFSSLAAYFRASGGFNWIGKTDAQRVSSVEVSTSFFPTLGVTPILGRNFLPTEDQLNGPPAVILSNGLWKSKFASARDVIGKTMNLNGTDYSIVGVLPADFYFCCANINFVPGDIYVPLGADKGSFMQDRRIHAGIWGLGRIKEGVTLAQTRADMARVASNLAATYPADKGAGIAVTPLKQEMVGDIEPLLLILLAAVGFVLLIACVNVANLLLARSTGRAREFAIRAALGARQSRIVRQLLTESVLLAFAGGVLGLLLAQWGTTAALAVLPSTLPRANDARVDPHVLLFTVVISLVAGTLFGLAPALKTSHPDLHETLKEGGRGASGVRYRTQGVFVIVETALAVVLLIGAGLTIRTLVRLWSVNPGFDPHNVLSFSIGFPPSIVNANATAIRAELGQVTDKVAAVPGVTAVALLNEPPLTGNYSGLPFWLDGQAKPANQNDMPEAIWSIASPNYLKVMRIPLLRGRFLDPQDDANSPRICVIDENFARKYFGGQDPIGKHLNFDLVLKGQFEIVGVVGHINQFGLDESGSNALYSEFYTPILQLPDATLKQFASSPEYIARTGGSPDAITIAIRNAVRDFNSKAVLFDPETMDHVVSQSLASRRFAMILLAIFAALALILSGIGIYGVVSYIAGQRTHEIGIRMALGASRGDLLGMVLRQGLVLVLIGIGLGLVGALDLTRYLSTLLYGVKPTDPLTFVTVSLILAFVALLACYIPARRAMRVDPMAALRYE